MQSRNSIRWLSFVLMTSASAAVFAHDMGAGDNVEGRPPVQGMTGTDADARGNADAYSGNNPAGADVNATTRHRGRFWNYFRGRSDPSGNTYGQTSGYYVGPFGPPPID